MFIIDPTLEEAKKEATIETVQGIIAKDGEVVKTDVMGMKKLAYPQACMKDRKQYLPQLY